MANSLPLEDPAYYAISCTFSHRKGKFCVLEAPKCSSDPPSHPLTAGRLASLSLPLFDELPQTTEKPDRRAQLQDLEDVN